jgi:AcrR family transcriptional regulator
VTIHNNSKTRGRPIDLQSQVLQKHKLIAAANTLLNNKTYKTIIIREIAEVAGTKSAMIAYYFGNKQGVFQALVEHVQQSQPNVISDIQAAEKPIETFITHILREACEHPGLVRFFHDELINEDSAMREVFIESLPKAISLFLPALIQQEIDKGHFRAELNPKYAAFSLMTMIMSPFVIAPIREQVWEISLVELAQASWAKHIHDLFISGCRQ